MKRVLLDVDGVIADWTSAALKMAHETQKIPHYHHDDNQEWDICKWIKSKHPEFDEQALYDAINVEGWVANLGVYPGAKQGVGDLMAIADVYFVTSPTWSNPRWAYERTQWLKEHFDVDRKHVIITPAKHLVRGDIFVDDKPEHVADWHYEHGDSGKAFLFDRMYNRSGITLKGHSRLYSLAELVPIISRRTR